jgi:hypothetical protein
MKGKPQIEHRQENHPVGDEAMSSISGPSAMLRFMTARTQRPQIPEPASPGCVVGLIAYVVYLKPIATPSPRAAAPTAMAVAHERQPPGELPAPASQIAVVISPPGLSGPRHQTLSDRQKRNRAVLRASCLQTRPRLYPALAGMVTSGAKRPCPDLMHEAEDGADTDVDARQSYATPRAQVRVLTVRR